MENRCTVCSTAFVLVAIGALNWGLVGLGHFFERNWNMVQLLLGRWPQVEWAVYIAVGIAGLFMLFGKNCSCRKKPEEVYRSTA